ncbi:MAG: hypothetical protein WCJ95_06890 [Mariniphaga sp.]
MQNISTLKNQLNIKDLFNAFKTQLAKDFDQSNFPSDFVETLEPDYVSILERIASELEGNGGESDLVRLLYRIDISELQLKKYFNRHKTEKYLNVIAELIIKRVLQKVVLKQFYSTNQNSTNNESHLEAEDIQTSL